MSGMRLKTDIAYEILKQNTMDAINDPKIGDRFHEMYSFWIYVIKITSKHVWVMSASAPCEFPVDGEIRKFTRPEYKRWACYLHSSDPCVLLADRGNDVAGWFNCELP